MDLFYAITSPYVRKVMICAHELGVAGQLKLLPAAPHPVNRDATIQPVNPLGKIPAARTDDGLFLFDSRVICEYLDARFNGTIFPKTGAERWQALTRQALADGLLDAALLHRYEMVGRPANLQWEEWRAGQHSKVVDALISMDEQVGEFGATFDIGTITFAAALGYLDFRFADFDWRKDHPRLRDWFAKISDRPSVSVTVPK
ncbi:glutathione S-transferase [Devosia sp. A449]